MNALDECRRRVSGMISRGRLSQTQALAVLELLNRLGEAGGDIAEEQIVETIARAVAKVRRGEPS